MELQQAQTLNSLLTFRDQKGAKALPKRRPEVDLLTDDHIRQMLGSVGANFQADDNRQRKSKV